MILLSLALGLGACASPYYDPVPPADAKPHVTRFDSPLSMEDSYRRLYARLRDCTPTFYHVQPRFDQVLPMATIMVVEGLGLNRYSFIGNRFRARFDVYPAGAGSRVEITSVDKGLQPLLAASRGWLENGNRSCSP